MQVVEGSRITVNDLVQRVVRPRTPGVHVTDCIDDLMSGLGVTYDDVNPEHRGNWIGAGYALEEMLGSVLAPEEVFRPGELVKDGIIGTPDWIEYTDGGVLLGESKCTWKSSRGFDLMTKKFLPWLFQLRAYCTMLETLQARMVILFVNDDYTQYIPAVRQFYFTFTPRELDENWTALCRHRDRRLARAQ